MQIVTKSVEGVKWPSILTNEEVYKITKVIPRSKKMTRRLTWLGHLRLSRNTSKESIKRSM